MAGYEKEIAKALAAIASPSEKVASEARFFAALGIDFESLSPLEAIACQDALYPVWQTSPERVAEREAEKAEIAERARKARLESLAKKRDSLLEAEKRDAARKAKRDEALAELREAGLLAE